MKSQITASHQIAHEIYVLSILKGVLHVDDERMPQLRQELALSDH